MNRVIKYLIIGWHSVVENKSRSLLTMLGIIIGIGSVILMISLGKGAEGLILASVESFGSRAIFIQPGGGDRGGPPSITAIDKLKYTDYLALKDKNYLESVTPLLIYDAPVVYQDQNTSAQTVGTNPNYLEGVGVTLGKGRFLDESDISSSARVAVIGYKIADKFFGDQNPIGKSIKIKKRDFKVVGVMSEQGVKFFQDFDSRILIPITTMRSQIFGVDYVISILGNAKGDVNQTIADLRYVYRKRHNIDNPEGDPNKDDVKVVSQVDAVDTFKQVSLVLTLFLVAVAAISLVVGGIGIMNIMLVSVTERTREIGLRKAVGATKKDILLQFLIEAVLITFVAGVIGVIGGISLSFLFSIFISQAQPDWRFVVSLESVLISFGFAAVIGLLFGIYPAKKAAELDPIEALRYE